jgi:O-antigen ligase
VLFAITIAFTVTPGIGGVLLAAAIWYWAVSGTKNKTLSKGILACGVLAAVLFLLVSTFSLIPSPTSPYTFELVGMRIDPTQRLLTWQGAVETFLQHPLTGRGLGMGVANVYFMPPSGQIQLLTDAHNALLNVAGQAGLFVVVPLVLIMIAVVRRSRLTVGSGEKHAVILASLGIAFFSALIYQGLVGSFENARHLWVLIGLILAVSRLRANEGERDPESI